MPSKDVWYLLPKEDASADNFMPALATWKTHRCEGTNMTGKDTKGLWHDVLVPCVTVAVGTACSSDSIATWCLMCILEVGTRSNGCLQVASIKAFTYA